MIKIICLGKLKEKYLQDLCNDYLERINKYHKIELIQLKDEDNILIEAKNIKRYLNKDDYIITLEIDGKSLNSLEFANLIDKTFINYSSIVFIIGSSNGIDDSIKNISSYHLSLSDMTFPHGLFRGILLEQIYRGFKIINHESYHK